MKKVLMISAILFLGWCYSVELNAQTACTPNPACKAMCTGAKASVGTTDAASAVQVIPAGLFAPGTQPAAGPVKVNCDPTNCDPSKCDMSKCDPSKCDMSNCDPSKCKPMQCTGKGGKTQRL